MTALKEERLGMRWHAGMMREGGRRREIKVERETRWFTAG